MRSGDLPAALSEITALPEGAQAVLAPWVADVEARAAAERGACRPHRRADGQRELRGDAPMLWIFAEDHHLSSPWSRASPWGTGLLIEMGEVATLTVMGREFVLTPLLAVLGAVALLLAVWLLFPGRSACWWRRCAFSTATKRRSAAISTAAPSAKGYEALAEGMMALAAGEGRLAIRKAERAESYLRRPELTKLVVAQGAEMVGDRVLATETFQGAGRRLTAPGSWAFGA